MNHSINLWKHNHKVFSSLECISTNDVLLEPTTGVLKSRNDADSNHQFIFSSPMDTVTGISLSKELLKHNQSPIFCRYLNEQTLIEALGLFHQDKNFWFSVGANVTYYQFIENWLLSNPKAKINIAIDVAHGDMEHLYKIYSMYKEASWCRYLMSGTVATVTSAKKLHDAGCSHIRVGIGPGSACSTRIVTGCGVPNLHAIYHIWNYFQSQDLVSRPKIIADGGIKNTGDIIKYLSAGADAVMIGNLLSKTNESCGWIDSPINKIINTLSFGRLLNGRGKWKRYRGQASRAFQEEYLSSKKKHSEGVQGSKQYPEYTTSEFIQETTSSISSALSYLGLISIKELNPKAVKFIRITQNALKESTPHLLNKN
tara:strand:- start:2357 stop:3466 length:1110 start_codon:yes stop_codon:yes gene_type:complete